MNSSSELVIREFREEDAPGLARLLNESEEGWPGGLTGGIPYTAERVLEEIRSSNAIAHYVAEIEGRLVGYLELDWHWLGKDAAYISLVNVHPDYRGRGIGTSLLKKAILKSILIGIERVDLHTWPGNDRAIRLYKKLGFFWVPRSRVYMQNYLPMIARNPIAKEFFKENLDSLFEIRRSIRVEEDNVRIKGRGVYIYEWKRDGSRFKVYIDREGWGICGIEWDDGVLELYLEDEEVIRGLPTTVIWRICNYSSRPLPITLVPECDTGIRLVKRPRVTVEVKPNDEVALKGEVLVDMNAPKRERDEPALRMKTLTLLNGKFMNLVLGLRCDYPISIEFLTPLSFYPRFDGEILLNVKNNTRKRVSCRLNIIVEDQLDVSPVKTIVELDKEEVRTIPLKLRVKNPDILKATINVLSELMINGNRVENKPHQFIAVVHRPGEVTGYFDEENKRVIIHKGRLLFNFQLKGGVLSVVDKLYDDRVMRHGGESVGPPFWPDELSRTYYDFALEGDKHYVKLLLKAELKKYPGVELRKTFELFGESPLVRITYELINNSSKEFSVQLRTRFSPSQWLIKSLAVPLKKGVLVTKLMLGEFPSSKYDLPTSPKEYSGYWSCYTLRNGMICGLLWSEIALSEIDFSYCKLPSLKYNVTLKPYSRFKLSPLYLYVGTGSWRDIEKSYHELYRGSYKFIKRDKLKLVELKTDPFPLIVYKDRQVTARLTISKARGKILKGYVYFTPSEKVVVEPKVFKVNLTDKASELGAIKVNLKTSKLGVYYANYKFSSNMGNFKGKIPVIVLGERGEVEILRVEEEGKEVLVIDNGLYLLKCSPEFGGTLYAIIKKGEEANNLLTSFPNPKSLSWMRSWHGGIRPSFKLEDELWREKWRADYSSIGEWTGAKVWTTATLREHEEHRGLKVTQHYLTKPFSNIILLLTEIENLTEKYVKPSYSYYVFSNPGGKLANYFSVFSEGKWIEWECLGPEIVYPISDNKQAMVYNERRALTLVSSDSEEFNVGAISMGPKHGCHLYFYAECLDYLKPKDVWYITSYLVLTNDREEAVEYEWLKLLKAPL